MITTLSCEAFLNMCDELYIAEEGFTSLNKSFSQITEKIETTKKEISSCKDLKKRLELCKVLKNEVIEMKNALNKDKSIQLKDIGFILKKTVLPAILACVFIGGGAMLKNEDPCNSKLAIGSGAVIGGLGAVFGADDYKQQINKDKKDYIKAIDEMVKKIDDSIRLYENALNAGIETIDQFKSYDKYKKTQKEAIYKINGIIDKMIKSIKPVDTESNSNSDKQMEKEAITFLKKVIAIPLFKTAFKDYLYLINFKICYYASESLFEVSITDYQSGIDPDNHKPGHDSHYNEWYYILLSAGEEFIHKRFKPWQGKIWSDTNTGDGDEGAIYVERV